MHQHLKYALEKGTNRIVNIENVVNGLECGCICPYCNQPLVAKNGGECREHHFAHYNNRECEGARMTVLHLLAQQIVKEQKIIMLPEYNDYYKREAQLIEFDEIELEKITEVVGRKRKPDCIGYKQGNDGEIHELWIEIFVHHKVDVDKQLDIKASGKSCVEIDFGDLLKTDYTKESVTKRLREEKHRRWINCPKYDKINQEKKLKHEQEEAERKQKENEEQERKEREIRVKLANQQVLRTQVERWYQDGNPETARFIINTIIKEPYFTEIDEVYEEERNMPNVLFDSLVPNNNYLYFINYSPKNKDALQLFYTLLRFYFSQTTIVDYSEIKQHLKKYQYKRGLLSDAEKIHIEELLSLSIVNRIESEYERYLLYDNYKSLIKCFVLDSGIRDEVLMVASVLYHHIVCSNATSFGELTNEIIQKHPHLAKSYLAIIDSQDRYPNDYHYGNRNMLDELRCFVENDQTVQENSANDILKVCYKWAFKGEILGQGKLTEREIPIKQNKIIFPPESEDVNEAAWKELNEMYKNA